MEVTLFILFAIASLVQGILLLFLFTRILFYKDVKEKPVLRPVSVIVAAHNEKGNLQRLVPLLLAQDYPEYEIIIVNDRSSDGTIDFLASVKNLRFRFINVKAVPAHIHPKKYALTMGITEARHEHLLFTDADCYPASLQWISEMQHSFRSSTEIVLGYSPYEARKGFLNTFIRYETMLTAVQYFSFALIEKGYMGVGRNLSYLKSLFTGNQGFEEHQNITGGDDDLFIGKVVNHSNLSICLSPKSWMYTIPKTTWKGFFIQKNRHLKAGGRYKKSHFLKAALYPSSHLLWYFSFIILIYSNFDISYILGIFILRTLVIIIIFALITRKLRDTIKWYEIPVLDLSYGIYFLITGVFAVFTKNIKWK